MPQTVLFKILIHSLNEALLVDSMFGCQWLFTEGAKRPVCPHHCWELPCHTPVLLKPGPSSPGLAWGLQRQPASHGIVSYTRDLCRPFLDRKISGIVQ